MRDTSNRHIKTDETGREIEFFFPKHNPPITIKARNREEADRKLAELNNNKEV
jgi:low affinity Fe/Cu permease